MAEEEKQQSDDQESKNWNISKGYTFEKVLKWLVMIDQYQTIAIFGYSKIESDVFIRNENLKNTARLHGLKRMTHAMLSLIRNTKFAIKTKDKKSFDDYTERLLKIEKNTYRLKEEKKRGNKVIELSINENLFDKIMEELTTMMDDINFKLNKASLIFAQPDEEYDPKKVKDSLRFKFVNRTDA